MKLWSLQSFLEWCLAKKSLLLAALLLPIIAVGSVSADNIARSFKSSSDLDIGSVVALNNNDVSSVVLVPSDEPDRIYGVVVDEQETPVSLQTSNDDVYVAESGRHPVLVSTGNGSIRSNDYLSMSATDGVAAKATNSQTTVLGRAGQDFDGSQNVLRRSAEGAAIGLIAVQVAPGKNPTAKESIPVPGSLRRLIESISGKPLSAARIYMTVLIFLVTMVIACTLIWVGVQSGIISIGRNPLSRHSILRSLAQIIAASVLVFIIGLSGVYVILRL